MFGLLTLVLVWSNVDRSPALGVLIAILLVVLEESAQLFVETRTFSMADFSASILGVCSAASLSYIYRTKAATQPVHAVRSLWSSEVQTATRFGRPQPQALGVKEEESAKSYGKGGG